MLRAAALAVLALGCPARPVVVDNIAVPALGTTIAIYLGDDPAAATAVIDDRREVTVANGVLTLDRIEPTADLPALIVESLEGPDRALAIGACTHARADASPAGLEALAQPRPLVKPGQARPALPQLAPGVLAPVVTCQVQGTPGTYFVRVLQVAPMPSFRAFHEVRYAGGERAQLVTRFALTTPAWNKQRAGLIVWTGTPGGEVPARAIAKGEVVLDGAKAVLANPAVVAPARLRRIFDGAVRDPTRSPTDPAWGRESQRKVQLVLELDGVTLTSGQVDVHLALPGEAARDAGVLARDRELLGTTHRLGVGLDDTLLGVRRTTVDTYSRADGRVIRQAFTLSVTNTSGEPRAVSIEERLRPIGRRQLTNRPANATLRGDILRVDVVVPPHETEQVQFGATYSGM